MFSVCNNCCIKPWLNQNKSKENTSLRTLLKSIWLEWNDLCFFQTNTKSVAVKILYVPRIEEETKQAYISRHNSVSKPSNPFDDHSQWKMVLLYCENLSRLIRGVTSKSDSNYYCVVYTHLELQRKPKSHEVVC